MAKSGLVSIPGTFWLQLGAVAAGATTLVECLNAGLNIMQDRLQVDTRSALMAFGTVAGAAIIHFFDKLKTEFGALAELVQDVVPGAELSLIFAAISALTGYIWYERSRQTPAYGMGVRQVLLCIVAVLTALPVLLSLLSVAVS